MEVGRAAQPVSPIATTQTSQVQTRAGELACLFIGSIVDIVLREKMKAGRALG
jgi:hypothetical protein